jgi:hypothetical protein
MRTGKERRDAEAPLGKSCAVLRLSGVTRVLLVQLRMTDQEHATKVADQER